MGNLYSEEDIERNTDELLNMLEAASDPVAYRERFHRRHASSGERSETAKTESASTGHRASGAAASRTLQKQRLSLLLITLLAILVGTTVGVLLNLYVL